MPDGTQPLLNKAARRVPERWFDTLERKPVVRPGWQPILDDLPIPTRRERHAGVECVYFVQEDDDGPVKIGCSTLGNVVYRVRQMQTGNARQLVLRRVVRGAAPLERLLHERYAEHRIRGEWFRPVPDVIETATPDVRPIRRSSDLDVGERRTLKGVYREGRDAMIRERVDAGESLSDVAADVGIGVRQVRRIAYA